MAGSLNKVMLIGNVGREPEIRSTSGGTRTATLSLATSESWRDRSSGEKKEKTEWHRVSVWGDGLVGIVEKYVHKGSKLYVEGKIQTRKWTDQQGQDRFSTEIVLSGFGAALNLLDGNRNGTGGGHSGNSNRSGNDMGDAYEQACDRASSGRGSDLDDEIPF